MYTRLHADENGIVGKGVKFERIRRVTGYLVGTLDRFNDAKKAEVHDRVKHMHLQEEQPHLQGLFTVIVLKSVAVPAFAKTTQEKPPKLKPKQ